MGIRKAVFPVGGLGSRFLPATKSMPKEMLPVVDKPLIQYAVEEAQAAGIEEFIFVTGRGKSAIEDHFDFSYELERSLHEAGKEDLLQLLAGCRLAPGQVAYTRQQQPLGLGHAVWCAKNLIGDEPFAVLLADDLIQAETPVLAQMVAAQDVAGGNMVAVMSVAAEETAKYGVIDPGQVDGNKIAVNGLVEKPEPAQAPSNFAVIGRYILQPEVFDHLERHETGSGGEIQLTDAMAKMIGQTPFTGFEFEGQRFDCGNKLGFLQATVAFGLARPELRDAFKDYLDQLS
jgi:UTP--glucose-1-phosphate uridylyltransferase